MAGGEAGRMTLDWVDDRLYAWALWARRGYGPTALSGETILYRIARDGALIRTGRRPEPLDSDQEQTDRAVTRLKASLPDAWAVVVTHYLERGTGRQKAKSLGMGHTRYYELLGMGQSRVAEYLDESGQFR